MKPKYAKVAVVVGLLFLLLLSSSEAMSLTLPSPPDRSVPANNQSGPLQNAQSFPGGVLLVKDGSSDENVSANEFIVEFFCISHGPYISKFFTTQVGESISAPITSEQASGIVDAVNSVRPPYAVNLTVVVGGVDMNGNITYTMTGMTYSVTTYSIWVTTQQSPVAEQRVGYVVVTVPVKPVVLRTFLDLTGSSCDTYSLSKYGPAWISNASQTFIRQSKSFVGNPLGSHSALPTGGVPPFFTYGPVTVQSSGGVAAAADIIPGENVTFALPPGRYSAVDKVTVLGIPISVSCGSYSSGAGTAVAQFAVTLAGVENVYYDLEIFAALVLIAIVVVIFWRFRLWPHVTRGLRRVSRAAHEWIDERMRIAGGGAERAGGHIPSRTERAGYDLGFASPAGFAPSPRAMQTL